MKRRDIFALTLAVLVSECAGLLGSFFTVAESPGWYAELVKPALTPPGFVFGPVWVTLYALMGVAAFLVWRKGWRHPSVRTALFLFGAQLVVNALWSPLFFGLHAIGWALFDILILWLLIIGTIMSFYRVSLQAALLLIPYALWVGFATYLNASIWLIN